VTELTYLLFLKMLEETKRENRLPDGYRWHILAKKEGMAQLDYYKAMLLDLGKAKDIPSPRQGGNRITDSCNAGGNLR
jgi:type I restriction enzyme M protein